MVRYDWDGHRLATTRRNHGWTQKQAATKLGVPTTRWTSWEQDRSSPRPPELAALGHLLKVHPSHFSTMPPQWASLSHLRAWSGHTLKDTATALDLTPSALAHIEQLGHLPHTWDPTTIQTYANHLNVTIDELTHAAALPPAGPEEPL